MIRFVAVSILFLLSCGNNNVTQENVNEYNIASFYKYQNSISALFPTQSFFLDSLPYPKEFNDYSNAVIQRYFAYFSTLEYELRNVQQFQLDSTSQQILTHIKKEKEHIKFINKYWYHFNFISPYTGGHMEILYLLKNYPIIRSKREFKRLLVLVEDSKRKLRSLKNRIELKIEKKIFYDSFSAPLILESFKNIENTFQNHIEKVLERIDKSKFTDEEFLKMSSDLSFYMEKFYLKYLVKLKNQFIEAPLKKNSFDESFISGLNKVYQKSNFSLDSIKKDKGVIELTFEYDKNYLLNLTGINLNLIKRIKKIIAANKYNEPFKIEDLILKNNLNDSLSLQKIKKTLRTSKDHSKQLYSIMKLHPRVFKLL